MEENGVAETLVAKIAALVRRRGWGPGEFAQRAQISKITARWILDGKQTTLRSPTVAACADALGLSLRDLYEKPLDELLLRLNGEQSPADFERRVERAMQPELTIWLEENQGRAATFSQSEIDKLYSMFGVGGPLTRYGVEHFAAMIERQRELKNKLDIILDTDGIDVIEAIVNVLWEKSKVKPFEPTPVNQAASSPAVPASTGKTSTADAPARHRR